MIGKLPPIVEKPVPVMAAEFTVTGVVPVDLRITDNVVAELTATLPKFRLVVLTVSWALAAVPVPLNATAAVPPLVELLLTVTCPLAAPVDVGLNCTCSVIDCCGLSVTGKA